MLERRQGDIIVFGSITGFAFARRLAAYCASKAAVNAFTEVLIHECRETPLRVLLVCPPAVNTPLISQATATGPAGIRDAATSQKMASPASIIDAIEAGIEARKDVIFPGEARMIYWMRRLSPRLLWWLADKSEQKYT
jgi:short-subunit dehydrogenase